MKSVNLRLSTIYYADLPPKTDTTEQPFPVGIMRFMYLQYQQQQIIADPKIISVFPDSHH
jgi:hypothetical protein